MARKLSVGLLSGLLALVVSSAAWGQDMDFGADPGAAEEGGPEFVPEGHQSGGRA